MKQVEDSVTIFVVEDDPVYSRMIEYAVQLNPSNQVFTFSTGKECLAKLHLHPQIVTLDYRLPDMNGIEVLQKIKAANPATSVIVLSAQNEVTTAVSLLQEGADHYIFKDKDTKAKLLEVINKLHEKYALINKVSKLESELYNRHKISKSITGESPKINLVKKLVHKAAQSNINVAVTGETGTGKEVIAKAIHYNSARKDHAFVAVNMSAIPNELLESELFGYEKGAFTGANFRKRGQFELADKGTLFLDEIGEMDINVQAKVLRVLQEREVTRVGGEKSFKIDIRIITATHTNLKQMVLDGKFREDLYYRLLGLNIHLPPLRERENDVILLAKIFLKDFCTRNGQPNLYFSETAMNKLRSYHYPGNIRELRAIVELAAVLAENNIIQPQDIQFSSLKKKSSIIETEMTMEQYKTKIILHFLKKYDDDIPLVAEKLDIGKSTIYRLLKEIKEKEKAI